MTNFELSVRFFLQLAFILGVCHVTGLIFSRLGQSKVVSEMIAGVVMGPSLFGWMFPEASSYLFPAQSKTILFAVCQVGLALYMFLVGAELDMSLLRKGRRSAASVSLAGILAPFALGAGLALYLADDPRLFGGQVGLPEIVLFLGASMSITAFPMLARLIREQGLVKTAIGSLTLAAASIDDVVAWGVLAILLALLTASPVFAVIAIGGGLLYALLVLLPLRRMLAPLARVVEHRGGMTNEMFLCVLCLVMLGAWFTDMIHMHAVFGAFLLGVAMPRGRFTQELEQKIQPLTTNFLMPLFFVYSGLNTKITLINTWELWLLVIVVMVAAVAGKFGACTLAARWHGSSWREATGIGTLMNARGMTELILLNIALERGIIQPTLFTVLVMMAILTTLMATPVFEWVYGKRRDSAPVLPEESVVAGGRA